MVEKRICTLYSGSGGNAIFFEAKGVKLIFDAGKNARSLCRALSTIGESIENIDAIFITHEHTDHISALKVFLKKYAGERKFFDGIPLFSAGRRRISALPCGEGSSLPVV